MKMAKLSIPLAPIAIALGRRSLLPKADSRYYVKLYTPKNKVDTTYQLPQAITGGPALSISHAVVNDTLSVTIKDNQKEKLFLIGHNYKQLFFAQPVDMTTSVKRIRFVLKDIKKA